jgi:hypothetical protein
MSTKVDVGDDVRIISGDHEGRSGRVVYRRDFSMGGREPEPYLLVEYLDTTGAVDQISVPARRTEKK